jgi:hypothetical protein
MAAESREDVEVTGSCDPAGVVADDDGTVRSSSPSTCLPRSDTVAGWLTCASCGLPQAPGKDFCGFCGRRWVTAS